MTDLQRAEKALLGRGFSVKLFPDGGSAAAYLNEVIDGTTAGFGGSGTLKQLGLFESLGEHNKVFWHWKQPDKEARAAAANTSVYLCSANAIAMTGEIVNIDGLGNRVASTLFGHEKLYIVAGKNKLAPTLEDAIWRARNIAAPRRAQQMNIKTPCAVKADRCYDCRSADRICCGLVVLMTPTLGLPTEVLLIDEELGL